MLRVSCDGDRISRPNSLLLDSPAPEKEPLRFDVQLVGAPPEVEQLVNNIKQVAEDFLYHWKTFPIVLPCSRFTGVGNHPSDLIIAPLCDELDAAALDAGLEPLPLSPKQLHAIKEKGSYTSRRLNAKQLESIKQLGEFEVPSRHFPGHTHVWRVTCWLQRGRSNLKEELHWVVAQAAALVVVVARDRLLRDKPFSLAAGARSVLQGMHQLLDLIFGMPSLEARDLDKKLREERSRYLVAELICKPEHQEDLLTLGAWVSRALTEKRSRESSVTPRVPCVYTTPQDLTIDLRLYRRDIMRRAAPFLQAILERESRGWFLHFREKRAAILASQKMPMKDIEEEVREAALREYVSRVCSAVLGSEGLAAIAPDLPGLLAAQLRAHATVTRAEETVKKKLESGLATCEARIKATHPILSRADCWRNEKLDAAAKRLTDELRWTAMESAASALDAHKLHQHRYLLLRELAFRRDTEPLLMKELKEAKTPTRDFAWPLRIWRPRSWVVTRHFRGRSEAIPTVLSSRATNIVTPRSDPSQPVFALQKDRTLRTCTRWPGWRLHNLAMRTWCWGLNAMFFLGVVVACCSAVSLRALLSVKPYVPDYELSQVNGTLFPKRSSETQTMCSRLLALWRHVSKQRSKFETEPDSGLLGKGLSRQANRAWNYGAKGGLGSMALLLLFPLLALASSLLAVAAAVSVPFWMPAVAVAVHVSNAAVYDLDAPKKGNRWFVLFEALIWQILVLGILQPVAALFVALVLCPIGTVLLFAGGISSWAIRSVWEAIVWRCIITRLARVPAHDSAFCHRVTGPTLHKPVYYQITAAQAVAAICAKSELESLISWTQEMERLIERPMRDYAHFVAACFSPFSVQIAKTGSYKQLEKECSELVTSLKEKVSIRKRELSLGLSDTVRSRVRMTSQDLKLAVQKASGEISRSVAGGEEWWARQGLPPHAWQALTATYLMQVFDNEVLVALDESSPRVQLESGCKIDAWSVSADESATAEPPDVTNTHNRNAEEWQGAWGEWAGEGLGRVSKPALELGAFSPRAPPHAALCSAPAAALVLYNRESENPIPLDSDLCAEILRRLEDAPDCDDKRDDVERYRGGGTDCSSELSSDGSHISAADMPPEAEDIKMDVQVCRISPGTERAACRWTLTGRGVRLKADLASPEDVSLDTDRNVGTSV